MEPVTYPITKVGYKLSVILALDCTSNQDRSPPPISVLFLGFKMQIWVSRWFHKIGDKVGLDGVRREGDCTTFNKIYLNCKINKIIRFQCLSPTKYFKFLNYPTTDVCLINENAQSRDQIA